MELIDTHCHLEKFARRGELDAVLARSRDAGVTRWITVGTGLDDWALYRDLAKAHPGEIFWTAGLHPCEVDEGWRDDVTALCTYFTDLPGPVALGEIGLDYFHLPQFPDEAAELKRHQANAFRAQLDLAYQFDLPVVIHSRGAFDDTLAILQDKQFPGERVVFHCFSEGADEMRRLNDYGGRGSFTGVVTYKNAPNVREALLAQGLDRVMVETDAPYLPPTPHRGKECEPGFTRLTAEVCAELLGVDLATFAEASTRNAEAFYGLAQSS